MVVLRAGKGFCKDRQEGALVGEKGWLGLQAVETEVRGPDTTHDVSILPSEKPIRNGLTSSQLKYSPSCVCHRCQAQSVENQRQKARGREGRAGENERLDLIYPPRAEGFPPSSVSLGFHPLAWRTSPSFSAR